MLLLINPELWPGSLFPLSQFLWEMLLLSLGLCVLPVLGHSPCP